MNHSLLKSSLLILVGALVMPFFTTGCGSRLPDETEITYRFSTTGENCQGISYGWVNEAGETETCHGLFTNGDVEVDCPVPESVSILIDSANDLEQISSASSYISVSESSACLARCEIWISGELSASDEILTIEDEHIATCRARIN
ncbi:MAG: hypothetical protein V3V44_04690 [Anaerolineales bacterium]